MRVSRGRFKGTELLIRFEGTFQGDGALDPIKSSVPLKSAPGKIKISVPLIVPLLARSDRYQPPG